ncbi:enoyl-CoA hydratase/isomerase family protein [Sphingobacteriaceae bacterium AH-315-L07]|nr:enoyl-CoA hydratase/isomerase family protein [Sphingobacteriaceae bacterium AH-315-L07]
MSYENIKCATVDGILTITLNRPDKLNALNMALLDDIKNAIRDATSDESVSGIIITGEGDKAFAAGADIAEFSDFTPEQGKELSANGHAIFNSIENCPKPVIAAVNGFALGGGCELAIACHMRVASENAKFGQPEVNLGLIPGYGGTQRLVQLVGKGKALELLMTADMIDAKTALDSGLVNYVTSQDELLDKCKEILNKIFTKGPLAVTGVINCVNSYFKDGEDGFQREIEEFGNCFGTEDYKEGTSAFLDKRKAEFKRR